MMKTILHVFYSGIGGHGSVFFSLVAADRERIFRYKVILYGIEDPRADYVRRLQLSGIDFTYVKKREGVDLTFWPRIFLAIRQVKPDIIFLHGSYNIASAIMAKLFSRLKLKIIVRETQANHLKTKLEWILLYLAIFLANSVVFLTKEYLKDVVLTFKRIAKKRNLFVVPNGIDLVFFRKAELPPVARKIYRIGMVSRIVAIKDHATLIRAFATLGRNDVVLCIAGEGPTLPKLQSLAGDLGVSDRIVFAGTIDETHLPDFYHSLDVYVQATLGETMSTSIMQAQACGLPIIAANVPGVANVIIDNVNGLLVQAQNPGSYSKAILELITNPDLRTRFGIESRIYAEKNLSMDVMFERYRDIYRIC